MPDSQGRIRWGILSTAQIVLGYPQSTDNPLSRGVIEAVREAEYATVAAVSSRDVARAQQAAERFDIEKFYGSYQDLLEDRDIDAIYNPLPNSLHAEWTIKAAKAGKHILCEKPLAVDAAEAQEMVDTCHECGVLLMEAFMYRFGNRNLRAREIVKDGGLGVPRLIKASWSFPLTRDPENIHLKKELAGGVLGDIGCYTVSLARFLFDSEPMSVDARLDFDQEFGVDINGVVLLEFSDCRRALLDFSYAMSTRQRYEVMGTAGTMIVDECFSPTDDVSSVHIERRESSLGRPGPEHQSAEPFPPLNTYTVEFDVMSRSILSGASLPWDGNDAVRQMQVLDAVRESHTTGRRVGLAPQKEDK